MSCPQPDTPGREVVGYPEPGGLRNLRAAIARLYPGLDADHVVVTNGATEALSACALVFAGGGQTVAIAPGSYPSFTSLARRFNSSLRSWDGVSSADVILLANPTVPDGQLLDMPSLAEPMHDSSSRLIADEVYLDLRPGAAGRAAALCSESAISIGDLSKPLGLSGLRIGWAVSRDRTAIGSLRRAVQELSGGPSTVAMQLAEAALERYCEQYEAQLRIANCNAPAVFAALSEAGWSFTPPQQGWTFLASPPYPLPRATVESLHAAGLFLIPASAFGRGGDGFRISLFARPEALRRALAMACNQSDSRALVLLAKAPEHSKSRLAACIGSLAASRLAEAFLRDTAAALSTSGKPVSLNYAPPGSETFFSRLAPFARLIPQPPGNLGDRIAAAIAVETESGSDAVLIGSDTPHLPPELLEEAFERLRDHDVVIGPATDGGFYLLGLRAGQFPPALFENVAWSTGTVFDTVATNAGRLGLRLHSLRALTDIDDLDTLRAALRERQPGTAPLTAALTEEPGLLP